MTNEDTSRLERRLADEQATARLAGQIACLAGPGDQILLHGELGSGKTAFARAFLRALADDDALEVPSPSFTIVQSYELAHGRASHLDLYRIGSEQELDELGLAELRAGILLVEWPERAPGAFAGDALEIDLSLDAAEPEARHATLAARGDGWARRLARLEAIEALLERSGLSAAHHRPLAGDASTRRYERLRLDGRTLVLMDAPAAPDPGVGQVPYSRQVHLAESVTPFAAVAGALHATRLLGAGHPGGRLRRRPARRRGSRRRGCSRFRGQAPRRALHAGGRAPRRAARHRLAGAPLGRRRRARPAALRPRRPPRRDDADAAMVRADGAGPRPVRRGGRGASRRRGARCSRPTPRASARRA